MRHTNRRDFLKQAAAGGAAAGTGMAALGSAPRRIVAETGPFHRVVYREFGSTGCKVSELGFGTMNTRDTDLIHAAIDSGINYIDTAHVYMNGANEELVGRVMETKRDKVFLVTKVGLNKNFDDVPREIETSLRRLRTDHVDLLIFHKTDDPDEILNDDIMKLFDDARRKGQTRFVGYSTHNFGTEVFDAGIKSEFWEAVLTGYNYFTPPSVKQSIQKVRESGMAVIGMKNLITMTWPPETRKPLEDIRGDKSASTPQQALIKWVLEDPYVDTTIPGMTSFEHLTDDLSVMGMKLSQSDRRTLRKYGEAASPRYCRGVVGCDGCEGQCPFGVRVRELNRCVMYARGYGNIGLAHENYRALPSSDRVDVCGDCEECAVTCVNGLNLTETVNEAKRLFG